MLGAGNIRDLWMPATCLILLTASIIYALVDLSNQVTGRFQLVTSPRLSLAACDSEG